MYCKTFITDNLDKSKPLIWDTETIGLYGRTRLIQVRQGTTAYEYDCFYINIEEVKYYFKDWHLVMHNAHYDLSCPDFKRWLPAKFDDTLAGARLQFFTLDSYSLDFLANALHLGAKGGEGNSDWGAYALTAEQLEYAANDTLLTQNLYNLLTHETLESKSYKLDIAALRVCLVMQHKGMATNRKLLNSEAAKCRSEIKRLQGQLPADLNILSPKQVKEYLGTPNADKTLLNKLSRERQDCRDIIDLRAAHKELNFIESFKEYPFIYSYINPCGAKTGRFTSKGSDSSPDYVNLQQIPRRLKAGFGVTGGAYYVCADYPTLEIRLAAAIWGDPFMVEALRNEKDLHYETASLLFKKPVNEVTKRERTIAKSCNFGLLYGAGAKTLAEFFAQNGDFDIMSEAPQIHAGWKRIYSTLANLHRATFDYFQNFSEAIVETPLGRKLKAVTPNEALNFPVQGGGAECTKLSLYKIDKAGIIPVNSVHDSIVCIASSYNEAQEYSAIIADAMEASYKTIIRNCKVSDLTLKVDCEISENYC